MFLGGAALAGAGQPQTGRACLLAVGGGGAGCGGVSRGGRRGMCRAGERLKGLAGPAGQARNPDGRQQAERGRGGSLADLCQIVDAMPNGLPTGRNGVPRIPLTTSAADAYQATRAHLGESDNAQVEAPRPSCGGSRPAAPRSSRNRVRCLPRAPAAGTWTGPTSDRASRTAPAFSGPAASTQTSRALRIEGRVSVSRVGGGFGAPRTATTLRSSYSAGMAGNRDAT